MPTKKKSKSARYLTQEEIWDDSALVESWNEALEEYKVYHSIAARGENVRAVLRDAGYGSGEEETERGVDGNEKEEEEEEVAMKDDEDVGPSIEGQGVAPDERVQAQQQQQQQQRQTSPTAVQSDPKRAADPTGQASTASASMPLPLPQAIMGTVQDETLKNLMMSWYYAGYYTGLYEGQQRGNQSAS